MRTIAAAELNCKTGNQVPKAVYDYNAESRGTRLLPKQLFARPMVDPRKPATMTEIDVVLTDYLLALEGLLFAVAAAAPRGGELVASLADNLLRCRRGGISLWRDGARFLSRRTIDRLRAAWCATLLAVGVSTLADSQLPRS